MTSILVAQAGAFAESGAERRLENSRRVTIASLRSALGAGMNRTEFSKLDKNFALFHRGNALPIANDLASIVSKSSFPQRQALYLGLPNWDATYARADMNIFVGLGLAAAVALDQPPGAYLADTRFFRLFEALQTAWAPYARKEHEAAVAAQKKEKKNGSTEPQYLQNVTDVVGPVKAKIDTQLWEKCGIRTVKNDDPSFPRLSLQNIDKAYISRDGRVIAGAYIANWLGTVNTWVLLNGEILASVQESTRFYRKADLEAITNSLLASPTHIPGPQARMTTIDTPQGWRYAKQCRAAASSEVYYLNGPDDSDVVDCLERNFVDPIVRGICSL